MGDSGGESKLHSPSDSVPSAPAIVDANNGADAPIAPDESAQSGKVGTTTVSDIAAAEIRPEEKSPAPDAPPDERPHFWLLKSDQLVVGAVLVTLFALMAVHWTRLSGWGVKPVEIDRMPSRELAYRIDVNRATWVEWAQLEGIGEVLADRIVRDREQNGPFQSIEDLQRVKGIGPKTVDRIRRWLTIGSRAGDPTSNDISPPPSRSTAE